MRIFIRKAIPKDLKQLEKISNKIFPNEDVFLIVNSMINTEHFYIAEETTLAKIIGFIIFGLYSTNIAHIFILAVEPEYQRKGVGTLILKFAEQIFQDTRITKIRLEVQIENEQAIDFYEKHRYQIVETIEKYYDDGSDAYLMVKEMEKKTK